jgi:hypothetical protein
MSVHVSVTAARQRRARTQPEARTRRRLVPGDHQGLHLRGDLLLRHTRATRRGLRAEEQAHNRAVRARAGPTLRQRLCALRALAREQTLRERAAAGVQARDVAVALRG